MKYLMAVSIFYCLHLQATQKISPIDNGKKQNVDMSLYNIIKYHESMERYSFHKKVNPAELSNMEILKIEELIDSRVSEFNQKEAKQTNRSLVEHPEKYYKQIVAITNPEGEKEVWVNCFCFVQKDWKKGLHMVSDGGSCYFHLKINLSRNTIYDFYVNTDI